MKTNQDQNGDANKMVPKKQTKYGCCWRCGEELPCWSRVTGHIYHETECDKCRATTRYIKDRSKLPGYKAETTP